MILNNCDNIPMQAKKRRSKSLENLIHNTSANVDNESTDRTRSPSPAPSSGLESNSVKDSPIQLDVLATSDHHHGAMEANGEHKGVICGGSIRGWLPDVAVILWRRMLGRCHSLILFTYKHRLFIDCCPQNLFIIDNPESTWFACSLQGDSLRVAK